MGNLVFGSTGNLFSGAHSSATTAPLNKDEFPKDYIYNGSNGTLKKLSIQGTITSTLPSADTVVAGVKEVFTFTPFDQATIPANEFYTFEDWDGNSYAVWFNVDGLGTAPTTGADTDIEVDLNGIGVKEASTVTFSDDHTLYDNAEFFVIYTPDGRSYGVWLQTSSTWTQPVYDVSGSPLINATFGNTTQKVFIDVTSAIAADAGSPDTNGDDVAALVLTELTKTGSKFAADFTVSRSTNVLTITSKNDGNTTNIAAYDSDGTSLEGEGSPLAYAFTVATSQAGSLNGDTTEVADAVQVAVLAALGGSPSNVFDVDTLGSPAVVTFTAREEGACTNAAVGGSPACGSISVTQGGVNGVKPSTDEIYSAAHGYATGTAVTIASDGSPQDVPAGLAIATTYYVINVDTNHFKLASSLANAKAGTAINITDGGTGTHTITGTALNTAAITLQGSNDGTNWVNVSGASQTVDNPASAADDFIWSIVDPAVRYYRVNMPIASGQLNVVLTAVGYRE